jgi:hypothetical protein
MDFTFKKLVTKIDSILCSYLGLDNFHTKPEKVELVANSLFIKNTEFCKRHLLNKRFEDMDLSEYSKEDKEKLGVAVGKSIAKNLIIKFVD